MNSFIIVNHLLIVLGAWIITGGMNTGIMKLVGEIVQINTDRSRPIHLIVNEIDLRKQITFIIL
jgi:hypothetical protein